MKSSGDRALIPVRACPGDLAQVSSVSPPTPEPFRIRSVEPIRLLPRSERRRALERAGYNLFRLPAQDVFIDLLTDSGTGAMSARQWAALHQADESYAGSASFARFADSVRDVTGFAEVIPAHQGRAAERILFETILRPGDRVVSNGLFDTTRANVERVGGQGIDLPDPAALDAGDTSPLKGGMDVEAFQRMLKQQVPRAAVLTCTSNAYGGHPVSLRNATAVSALCHKHGIPLFIDAARFAENAALLKLRDPECRDLSVREISRLVFALADGCMMSAKKNGLAHIGGFLAVRDAGLAERLRENLIVTEGFESYGGLAGRDLDAIALGLQEVLDEDLLLWRVRQVERLAADLVRGGVPVELPAGGHAVYVDAGALLRHIPAKEFPGHAFACAMYLEGGVRSCEIGSLMFPGRAGGPELTRLAIPWRTYTDSHLQYVAAAAARIAAERRGVRGLALLSAPKALRHFKATLAPIEPAAPARVEEARAAP